jgi:hypothetical protein
MLRWLIKALFPGLMIRIEAESRTWMMQCPNCGFETSVWEAGGMRYKGLGSVYRLGRCRVCGKIGMLRVYQRDYPDR